MKTISAKLESVHLQMKNDDAPSMKHSGALDAVRPARSISKYKICLGRVNWGCLGSDKGTWTRTGLKFSGSGPNRAGPGPDTGAGPV